MRQQARAREKARLLRGISRKPVPRARRLAAACGCALLLSVAGSTSAPNLASAVLIASGDGTGNTAAPSADPSCSGGSPGFFCDFPHWNRILELDVPNNGCTFTYLGAGWVASADHSPCNDTLQTLRFVESGARVEYIAGTFVELDHLTLFIARVRPAAGEPFLPDLPILPIADASFGVGVPVIGIGRGQARDVVLGPPTCGWGTNASAHTTRWGTNVTAFTPTPGELRTNFDCTCGGGASTTHEYNAVSGDSGGGVFAVDTLGSGEWEFAGVIWGSSGFGLCGGFAAAMDLSAFRTQILDEIGAGVDTDSDGVDDPFDNCSELANPDQVDADGDGFGNACDKDVDQNNLTGGSDFGAVISCFVGQTTGIGPPDDPDCTETDFDGNGVVGGSDWGQLKQSLGQVPGPSGRACADPFATTPVCP